MSHTAVYLVPASVLAGTDDVDDDPIVLLSRLDAEGAEPVDAWRSPHDVIPTLLGGWDWTYSAESGAERLFVMGLEDLEILDIEDLDERAHGVALQWMLDPGELEGLLEDDSMPVDPAEPTGALVTGVRTVRRAVAEAADRGAALAVVVRS